jgi:hypothetical protein
MLCFQENLNNKTMDFSIIADNFMHPPVLFFFLGIIAIAVKSDLEIPPQLAKFLSIYLLFDIGIKGGEELFHSGFNSTVLLVMATCLLASFLIPFVIFPILSKKLDIYNAGAIAGTYGSISAVTFATASTFLASKNIAFGGYMVAGMALMESPAIVAGLILIRSKKQKENNNANNENGNGIGKANWKAILKESFFNGSVLLLVGSLIIGLVTGQTGEDELKPFVNDIFKGMLSLYMLDMGLMAGRRLNELRKSGTFLTAFSLLFPLVSGMLGIAVSKLIGLDAGDALLQTILFASASYIAVPAAMRMAVPQANMSLLLPMSLGVTFTFNISLGIPLYYTIINYLW